MAAKGKPVCDFGLRRAQGMDAGLKSSRASYIGECAGTSNVLAGKEYKIPITGTVAHSFILAYESEIEAFRAIARNYGDGCVFLIDTYDTLQGARNAVKVAHEMEKEGKKLGAVRIDSGNLAKLSGKVRKIFDAEGLGYVKIIASGGLDEYKVEKLADALAPIDSFGVGTAMDVSADAPCLDMNYKLCEYEGKGRRKTSAGKATLPGKKQLFRLEENGVCVRDVIALEGEKIEGSALLVKMMGEGRIIWKIPGIGEIRKKCKEEIGKLPIGVRKIKNPSKYPVGLSEGLLAQI